MTRRVDTPRVGFDGCPGGVAAVTAAVSGGAGADGVVGSGAPVVLDLTLLGLVWLVGLTAVHCVPPTPLRRCRAALRGAAGATARMRSRMPRLAIGRPAPR